MTATKLDLVKVEDWGLFTDTTKPIIIFRTKYTASGYSS